MRRRSLIATALSMVAAVSGVGLSNGGAATAAGRWTAPAKATIHPGVQMYTDGAQCTGNFVFTDNAGRVYVGYAAHCAGVTSDELVDGADDSTETNGCKAASLPLGTPVRFASGGIAGVGSGETVGRGRLVYSSWLTMQRLRTTRTNPCEYNDFALVRVGRKHVGKVNPTVPYWGGPVGLAKDGSLPFDDVFSYGNSSLRGGVEALAPKQGVSLGHEYGRWTHPVYTASPGVPGDSGSAFLDSRGRALGTLSTITIFPLTGSNGVSDLSRELAFAKRHSGIAGLRLVKGTRPFSSGS